MNKIKNILIWLTIITYLIVSLSFVSTKEKASICSKIEINIVDNTENQFVEEQEIINALKNNGEKLLSYHVDSINTDKIEQIIYQHTSIKKAVVYIEKNEILKIDITQRNPIVRVVNYNNESYYIDQEGYLMPLSKKYTAHVPIVNGNINEPLAKYRNKNLLDETPDDDEFSTNNILKDVFILSKYIYENDIWKSLVEQIYINEKNEFELVPKIGVETIMMGDISDYENKFIRLDYLYKIGFPKTGWRKYKSVNLKYTNQAICTKR
ncbi:MAG: hypothetical protein A2236_13350 [Bacteroidetes bacterium RIFOXYA2_FULL_33_7]|nr:MAG: hypothetical protein A2236_13350 [Bacteroidetes bacterium RIFOXYA2_FULL_33_7]